MQKKVQVKPNTFKGESLSVYNGALVTPATDKQGVPIKGKSPGVYAYTTSGGGYLFLHESQVQKPIED